MTKHLRFLFACFFSLTLSGLRAQTINYTSTPVTSAFEKVPYSSSLSATIDNTDELTFSAPLLPSWLALSSSGATGTTKVSDYVFQNIGGVAGDASGNYYVVENGNYYGSDQYNNRIFKITPDGNATPWAIIDNNQNNGYYYSWCYSMIIVDHYLYAAMYDGSSQGIVRFDLNQQDPQGEQIYSGYGVLSMTYHEGYIYTSHYDYGKIGRVRLSDNSYSDYIPSVPSPFGLGFTNDGTLLIATFGHGKILKYSGGVLSDAVTNIMHNPSDVKIDKNGNVYVSFYGTPIRKYTADLSSYTEILGDVPYTYSMTFTPNNALVYSNLVKGQVYALQTGATLTGTPGHEHVGVHPVKVTVTNGTVSKDLEFSITVTDPNPPTVEIYRPANNSTEIALDSTLQLVFSETILKGSGKIFIKSKSDNSVLKTFDISDNAVTVTDSLLSVKLGSKLPYLTEVYIEIESGAVKDVNDNDYVGISNATGWAYTTVEQTQVEQVITFAGSKSVSYGIGDFAPDATTDSHLEITYTSSDESIASIVSGKVRVKKPGVVTITAKQEGNEDYFEATPVEQQLTINKKEIEVSLIESPSISKIYDGNKMAQLADVNYQLQGVVDGDEVSVKGLASFDNANAGTNKVVLVHSFALSGNDKYKYALVTEQSTVSGKIIPAKVNVTAINQTKIYGASDAEFSYEVEGLLNNDKLTGSLVRETGRNVGEYKINLGSLSAGNNYEIKYTAAKLTITPANLLIKAEDKSRDQGKINPSFTFSYQGLVAGDGPSALSTQPQAQTIADQKSPIGYYDITVGGANSSNYNISYTKGRLTVVPGESSRVKAWSSSPSVLQVRIYSETAQKAALVLYTDAGQSIILQRHQLNAGVNNFTINVGSLTPNIYILHVNADKFKESERVKIK